MITNPAAIEIVDPVLVDAALLEVQILLESLSWIDRAYGKVKHLKEKKNGKILEIPAIYTSNDYLNLLPDTHLGNYCFFDISDGEKIKYVGRQSAELEAEFSLIFFFDYRIVYPLDWKQRTIENVKSDIITIIKKGVIKSQIRIQKAFEDAENVFKGFSHSEIDNQFNMKPFGVLRLEGKIKYNEKNNC